MKVTDKLVSRVSEDDIRTKVVAVWLFEHGFTAESISVEFSFELRLGRNIYRVGEDKPVHSSVFRPRADVLVRSCDGRNLLIIEVKAPDEILDDNAKEQSISYARLLRNGGIAPFVVLTNGHETRIYDSISGELVSDTQVPINHPHAQNKFRVSVDDIELRTEALETFVSISPESLLEFCRSQVNYRMRLLRSNDPFSGKKYIPALYVEREEIKKRLSQLLDEQQRRVIPLVGAPQVGKTNFVCHAVEEKLEQGIPCLFYPAIGMEGDLLQEIGEDFGWILKESNAPHQIFNKLTRILRRTGQRLIIFIDGWNEASQALAEAIDRSSERISCDEIQIVISFTNIATSRLLFKKGNPSYIAESADITFNSVPLIEIGHEKIDLRSNLITIKQYNPEETQRAYDLYSDVYKVQIFNSHKKVYDPFLLRIAMELSEGQYLPESLDEPLLLQKSIYLKASRTDLQEDCVISLLSQLADEMLMHDAPISQVIARKRWCISATEELPKDLFEAAFLSKVYSDENIPGLDFYYGRERDFVIAIWSRQWNSVSLDEFKSLLLTLAEKNCKSIETDALKWFLKQSQYYAYLEVATQNFSCLNNPVIKRAILLSVRSNPNCYIDNQPDWMKNLIDQAVKDSSMLVRVEAAKLVAQFAEDKEWLASILGDEQELKNFMVDLLEVDEEYSLSQGNAGQIILDSLKTLHWESCSDYESDITDILVDLMRHHSSTVRVSASKAIGYILPKLFLQTLNEIGLYQLGYETAKEYTEAINIAIDALYEIYDDSMMCQGYLNYLLNSPPEEHINDHQQMWKICMPVITFYWTEKCGQSLLEFLNSIAPKEEVYDNYHSGNIYSGNKTFLDENIVQLSLDFEKLDLNKNAQ
ncbi:type I restriction enzyme HsdR N-terminal domain-containing protein [Anabaena sp. WFMT]|uniref:type I restriction enzyme HsdR N-terminal domain-containing protein n=1 Tax=Anabaena sp. WFMT TaxID=3449730 RepID=UPI003F235BB8